MMIMKQYILSDFNLIKKIFLASRGQSSSHEMGENEKNKRGGWQREEHKQIYNNQVALASKGLGWLKHSV